MDVPMKQMARSEMRRSSPVVLQAMQMRSAPSSSTTISVKYWEITWLFGIREQTALTAMGSIEVTAMCTGRKIHQRAIQKAVPTASAPAQPVRGDKMRLASRNARGPDHSFFNVSLSKCIILTSAALSVYIIRKYIHLEKLFNFV